MFKIYEFSFFSVQKKPYRGKWWNTQSKNVKFWFCSRALKLCSPHCFNVALRINKFWGVYSFENRTFRFQNHPSSINFLDHCPCSIPKRCKFSSLWIFFLSSTKRFQNCTKNIFIISCVFNEYKHISVYIFGSSIKIFQNHTKYLDYSMCVCQQ